MLYYTINSSLKKVKLNQIKNKLIFPLIEQEMRNRTDCTVSTPLLQLGQQMMSSGD